MVTTDYSEVVCVLSLDDIPNLKKILEITLKSTGLQPTQRLELFARLCGYKTMASLNSDLKDKSKQKLPCLILRESEPQDDAFIQGLPEKTRMALAKLDKVGILNLVAVGLIETWHPVFGDVGVDPNTTIESLSQLADKIKNDGFPSASSYRKYERQISRAAHVIILTPDNLNTLRSGISELTNGPKIQPSRGFAFYKVKEKEDGFFDVPEDNDIVILEDKDEIYNLLNGNIPVFFDSTDLFTLRRILGASRSSILNASHALKDSALYIDEENEGDIFTVGYHGATNCELPTHIDDVDHCFALRWLSEITIVVHSFRKESARISMEQ